MVELGGSQSEQREEELVKAGVASRGGGSSLCGFKKSLRGIWIWSVALQRDFLPHILHLHAGESVSTQTTKPKRTGNNKFWYCSCKGSSSVPMASTLHCTAGMR